jgi:hypothetical protein
MSALLLLLAQAVDPNGLEGKVLAGYQGWFNAEGDGAGRGWTHWTKRPREPFAPGNAKIDLWPDVSELGPDERFASGFRHADGRPAEVFSSTRPATVRRHFRWMRDAGIDGAFVQRFITDLRDPRARAHVDAVLAACREGARESGRVFALMYDLTGMSSARLRELDEDWKGVKGVLDDPRYLRHEGKPLVAVWGVGFNDGRAYALADAARIVQLLRDAGCSVLLGVPTGWRTLDRDAAPDPALHALLKAADVVSPHLASRRIEVMQEIGQEDQVVTAAELGIKSAAVDRLITIADAGLLRVVFRNFQHGFPIERGDLSLRVVGRKSDSE